MKCKFLTQDYGQRLHDTMCRYMGDIVYLNAGDGEYILGKYSFDGEYFRINNPEDIDVSSITLGYINTENGTVYVSRRPSRGYKQGVCSSNVIGYSTATSRRVNVNVNSYDFFRMAKGEYPTLSSVLERKDPYSVAVSRDVSITLNEIGLRTIDYKGRLVGWMAPNSEEIIVADNERRDLVAGFLGKIGLKVKGD